MMTTHTTGHTGKRRRPRVAGSAAPGLTTRAVAAPDSAAPDQPFAEGVHDTIDPDLRHRLISETAYRYYAERGYADGYDVDDWLQAEAEVDHLLLERRSPSSSSD